MFEVLALAATLAAATPAPAPAAQHLSEIAVRAPKAVLHLQVAKTEEERERGLMSVRALAPHTGMVFVFGADQPVTFWMKDTLLPLDMIFVSSDGTVRDVAQRVPVVPLDTPDDAIPRVTARAAFVIELPAGEAVRDGLHPGARISNLPHA